jgi:mRNA interferase RelE/StbE
MKTVVLAHPAAKELDGLPADVREAIERTLAALAVDGSGDVKPLGFQRGAFRLRVGRYRVLFQQTATEIHVGYVGKRETTTYR